jgi:hypothetical protein
MEQAMKHLRVIPLAAAVLCLVVSLSAGWLWSTLAETSFEAHARLALVGDPFADSDRPPGGSDDETPEDRLLAPELLSAAVDLLHDRGVTLSLASPFDSQTDYILSRIHVEPVDREGSDEIRVACTAPDAGEALQVLTALVDACLAAVTNAQSASSTAEAEDRDGERRQLVRAIERQERTIAALGEQLRTTNVAPNEAAGTGDDPAALESELAGARQAVVEAERRLDHARRDFDRQLPAEVVAAQLPDSPVRTKILERLSLAKLKDELRQQEILAEKLSAVYGRNHPRMTALTGKIGQLRKQIPGLAGEADGSPIAATDADPQAQVLGALELELADARVAGHQIERRLIARHDRSGDRQELQAQLGEARQELAFLHGEYDRMRQETQNARQEQTSRMPTVIEPPTLSPDPIVPPAGLQMAVSCVAGMALYLFILWQFRKRLRTSDAPPDAQPVSAPVARGPVQGTVSAGALAPPLVQIPESPGPASRHERLRTQDEQRLARLKMLSSRGSVPVQW